MKRNVKRRSFLLTSAAIAGGMMSSITLRQSRKVAASEQSAPPATLPERTLGNTGISLPILGLGGASRLTPLSQAGAEAEAIALVQRAWELGIRYFDTAATYGPSEDYLGKVLPAYRSQVFLTSKTAIRDRDGAWRELERSLQRLQTDYLDLWQLHHVSFAEELETIFSRDGAIHALVEAKQQGIVRLVGITGHHEPDIIINGLRRYPFDTTLIPVNAVDKHHPRPFIPGVLPIAQEQKVGVIAMKVPAYGKLFQPGALTGMAQALGYTLSQPGVSHCIIAADSIAQLEANVDAARSFQPLAESALSEIEQKTVAIWQESSFYRAWH
jgi:aryl-alcohol dehydrogenase-like predicted oxidoreductase